jgi:hypothetical protein
MSNSPLSRAVVENIFRALRGRFGSEFVNRYRSGEIVPKGKPNEGKDTGLLEAMDVWAYELRDLSTADIQHGLNSKFRRAPSSDEFIQACVNRDYRPPNEDFKASEAKALAAPRMSREEAQIRLSEMGGAVKTTGTVGRANIEWAYTIARQVEQGVYRSGSHCCRMAAEAIRDARQPVPECLRKYLPNYPGAIDEAA